MSETPETKHYLTALLVVALAFLLLALLGCKSQHTATTAAVATLHHDTLFIFKTAHDTLRERDSIYVHEAQRGDTVLITKYHDRTLYKIVERRDTVYKSATDTLRAVKVETRTVTREVPAQLTAWQRFRLRYFAAALIVCIALIMYVFRTQIKKAFKHFL